MKKEKETKGKYWTLEMYEDSRPENWKEILEKTMLKIAVSPRHDKDKKEDGTLKKPHYHILLCYEGPTTMKNVTKISEKLGSNGYVQQVYSAKGCYDYLTHKHNEEKAKYNEEDIIKINGFDIDQEESLTKIEIEEIKRDIVNIIRDNGIVEYSKLYDKLLDSEMYEHTKVLSTNTIFFVAYLRSRRFCLTNIPH